MQASQFFNLLKETFLEWVNDKCSRLGAALAFYSALSIGPLLIIVLAIGGMLFANNKLSDHLIHEMENLIGSDGADVITTIIANSQQPKEGLIASLLGLCVLLLGASGVFGELQDALNTIWAVPVKTRQSFLHVITARFVSFAMVLGTGFILLISLVITAVLNGMTDFIQTNITNLPYLLMGLNWFVSLLVSTALFALIFKQIPDIKIRWSNVWWGALITALLFDAGKMLIGMYLGHSAIRTTYGAAGSFVIFLLWIYYSAQILYFGAEFTKVQTRNLLASSTSAAI